MTQNESNIENDIANGSNAENDVADVSIDKIDPQLTLTLATASVAAYNDYQKQPFVTPLNYECVGRFYGWDDFIFSWGSVERYGLIFKYIGPEQIANRYIVAFRGTDSLLDAYNDLFWEFADFKPYRNSIALTPKVCSGFYDIYSTKGGWMTHTMQQQVFSMLPDNPSEVLITGHSLGAALAQLFTLDMRISSPNINIRNINFASPRVGGTTWRTACNNSGATRRITRVINYWDVVPDTPIEEAGYVSVGSQFQTSFFREGWGSKYADHSLLNLQKVLINCVYQNPQVWCGKFQDATDPYYQMKSTKVPVSEDAKQEHFAKLRELSEMRRKATDELSACE